MFFTTDNELYKLITKNRYNENNATTWLKRENAKHPPYYEGVTFFNSEKISI